MRNYGALVLLLLLGCEGNLAVQSEKTTIIDSKKKVAKLNGNGECVDPDLNLVSSQTTLTLCDGTSATGLLEMPEPCTSDGGQNCITSEEFPAADKVLLESAVTKGVTIGGIEGSVVVAPPEYVIAGFDLGEEGQGSLALPDAQFVSADAPQFGPPNAPITGQRQGGYVPGKKIIVQSQPNQLSTGKLTRPLRVMLADADSNPVSSSGVSISIHSPSLGALSGQTMSTTDGSGEATIGPFSLDTVGLVELTVSAAGYNDTTLNVEVVTSTGSDCSNGNGSIYTVDGGCYIHNAGLVVGRRINNISWHEVIWDANTSGSSSQEPSDGARTDDYHGGNAEGVLDNNPTAICHDSVQSGYSDWRVPTQGEIASLMGYFATYLPGHRSQSGVFNPLYWSATSDPSDGNNAYFVDIGGVSWSYPKTTGSQGCTSTCGKPAIFCVRSL